VAYGTRFGYNAGNGFTVAPAFMRAMAQLTVGRQYYLNIANRDSSGKPTCTSGCEVRIQSTHP
jgi:hypothetical protein